MASGNRFGCGTIFFVFFVVAVIGGSCSKQDEPQTMEQKITEWKSKDNSGMAYAVMQDYVKKRLKSPASADFPWSGEDGVSIVPLGDQEYRILGYVDAQNSFGAKLRTRYIGIIKNTDMGQWQLKELAILE